MSAITTPGLRRCIRSCVGQGLFFQSDGAQLYGFLEIPPGDELASMGVLFVHGAFEERQDAHLVMRDAAERLARAGFPTLRFDLYGHGDSEGEFADATIARWTSNTVDAARTLAQRSGCTRIAIVALRAGALVAAAAAANVAVARADGGSAVPPIDRLVLWQPVLEGRTYVADVLRSFIASEMMVHRRASTTRDALVTRLREGRNVNVAGYSLSPALYAELCAADLARELERLQIPVLCLDVSSNENAQIGADLARIDARLGPRVHCRIAREPQPLHTEGRLFLTRTHDVFAQTARFLGASA